MPPTTPSKRHLPLPGVLSLTFIGSREKFTHEVETRDSWTLLGAQAGKFRYAVGGAKSAVCLPGEFVLCPPGVALWRTMLEKMAFYVFSFSWRPPELQGWPGKHSPRDAARLDSTLARLQALQNESGRNRGSSQWQDHLLSDLLNLCAYESQNPVAAESKPADRLMVKVSEHLQAHLATSRLLEEIAREFRISPFQLSRRFQAAFGVSPAIYRTRLRMKQARKLLLDTAWTVEHIAEECGFENAFYFSRVFSRENGQAPSAFRKQARF